MLEDPNYTFDEILALNAFKSPENLFLKAGNTYWFRVDFKNELDTLQTQESWRLRVNYFSKATLYYQSGQFVQQKTIGQINKKEGATFKYLILFN